MSQIQLNNTSDVETKEVFPPLFFAFYYAFGLIFGIWATRVFFLMIGMDGDKIKNYILTPLHFVFGIVCLIGIIWATKQYHLTPQKIIGGIRQKKLTLILVFILAYTCRLMWDFVFFPPDVPYFTSGKLVLLTYFSQTIAPLFLFVIPLSKHTNHRTFQGVFVAVFLTNLFLLIWCREFLGTTYRGGVFSSGISPAYSFFTVHCSTVGAVLGALAIWGWKENKFNIFWSTSLFFIGCYTCFFGETRAPLVALLLSVIVFLCCTDTYKKKRFWLALVLWTIAFGTAASTASINMKYRLYDFFSDTHLFVLYISDKLNTPVSDKPGTQVSDKPSMLASDKPSMLASDKPDTQISDKLAPSVSAGESVSDKSDRHEVPFVNHDKKQEKNIIPEHCNDSNTPSRCTWSFYTPANELPFSPQLPGQNSYESLNSISQIGTGRWIIWQHAFVLLRHNLVFGTPVQMLYSTAHNAVIEAFVSLGVLGGFCFIVIVIRSVVDALYLLRCHCEYGWISVIYAIILFVALTGFPMWGNGIFPYIVILRCLAEQLNTTG